MAPAPFVTKKAPAAKTTLLKLVRSTSSTGILAIVPVSCTRSKSGVSAILNRINNPTATSTILSRKGILQPIARKSAFGKDDETILKINDESRSPIGTPNYGQLPKNPRLAAGECSVASSTAPP